LYWFADASTPLVRLEAKDSLPLSSLRWEDLSFWYVAINFFIKNTVESGHN